MNSQSRDLETILGTDRGVPDELMRRSDFFQLPWVSCAAMQCLCERLLPPSDRSKKLWPCTKVCALLECYLRIKQLRDEAVNVFVHNVDNPICS